MPDSIQTELRAKEARLQSICSKVARSLCNSADLYSKQIAEKFELISETLLSSSEIKQKQEAARQIRACFHKEGVQDRCPSAIMKSDWDKLVNELFDLSTIYVESRYANFL